MDTLFTSTSLLWPDGKEPSPSENNSFLPEYSFIDIGVDSIVKSICINEEYYKSIKAILSYMCTDLRTINYRLDILEDFLQILDAEKYFAPVLDKIGELEEMNSSHTARQSSIIAAASRIRELGVYSSCLRLFKNLLDKISLSFKSEGMRKIHNMILKLFDEDDFIIPEEKMPKLDDGPGKLASVTIGINLDANLRPVEATVLSLSSKKITHTAFFKHLFEKSENQDELKVASEVHSEDRKSKLKIIEYLKKSGDELMQLDSTVLQLMLINDLDPILNTSFKPVTSILERLTKMRSGFLIRLRTEIAFYLGAVRLINRLRQCGLDMCRPTAAPMEDRLCDVYGAYNIHLALRNIPKHVVVSLSDKIIANDIVMDDTGRIFILTGPNSGGKTTYIQAVAALQAMFQAGIYVPASCAKMSPVDNIYTHFPAEEKTGNNSGRLGEESRRFNDIFNKATRYSLIILNESFTSTSPNESYYLSRDIVCGLRYLSVRAVFATHLHELGEQVDIINAEVKGDSLAGSLVAGTAAGGDKDSGETAKRTYRIAPGKPQGLSYAKDIANSFGISFEQIVRNIDRRLG